MMNILEEAIIYALVALLIFRKEKAAITRGAPAQTKLASNPAHS